MDHSHMDHGDMNHGGHGDMDHGDGGMHDMCNMNMLFTWDTKNLCIVFSQWHIRSNLSLFFSLVAVVLIAVGYEGLRSLSRRYEDALARRVQAAPTHRDDEPVTETTPFLAPGQNQDQAGQRAHIIKAVLYALQNFYAFMLMLIFMTYNGWVMIAVTLGAFLGYVIFGKRTSATKDNACH